MLPPFCVHTPSITVASAFSVPSYLPPTAPTPRVSVVPVSAIDVTGMPRAPWSMLSSVALKLPSSFF